MGFFKKLGKKLRGAFKKIGRGIKKGFQKFGKFMNKIGIMGQIAMFFILPAVGSAMLRGIGGIAGLGTGASLGTAQGFSAAVQAAQAAGSNVSLLARGVGWTLDAASKFAASPIMRPFKTVTDAVSGFIDNTTRFVGNKVGLSGIKPGSDFSKYFAEAPDAFFKSSKAGGTSVLGEVGQGIVDNISQFTYDIGQGRVFTTEARPKVAQLSMDDIYEYGYADVGGDPTNMRPVGSNNTALEEAYANYENPIDPEQLAKSNAQLKTESLLSRAGEFIKAQPREFGENVVESLKPSNLASNYVQQTAINPLLAPDAPRQGTPFGSVSGPVQRPSQDYSMAYASLMSQAPATSQMFGSEYDYFTASQSELYGSPQGQWGGINAYNDYMARFA